MIFNRRKTFEKYLIESLSFYAHYTLHDILLSMDEEKLLKFPHLSMQDLENLLANLVTKKKIIFMENNGQRSWKRVFKEPSKWSNFLASI